MATPEAYAEASAFAAEATLRPSHSASTAESSASTLPFGRVTRATSLSRNGVSRRSDSNEAGDEARSEFFASLSSSLSWKAASNRDANGSGPGSGSESRFSRSRSFGAMRVALSSTVSSTVFASAAAFTDEGEAGDAGEETSLSLYSRSAANDENVASAFSFFSTRFRAARSSRSSVCVIPSFARSRRACSCCRCSASRGWFATFRARRSGAEVFPASRRLAAPRSRSSHCCIGVRCVCHRGTSEEGCVGARCDAPRDPPPKSAGRARSPESTAAGTLVGRGGGTASREPPSPSPSDASQPSRNESVSEATSNLAAGMNPARRDIAALHVGDSRASRFQRHAVRV
mmetsp:Transcript_15745/g.66329  ORF Transcript_15745/g.66329 Transcript_15745/m.66329 type:complete len:345 (+) Transcript_15745:1848-2882(+)